MCFQFDPSGEAEDGFAELSFFKIMKSSLRHLLAISVLSAGSFIALSAQSEPVLTVDIQSYEKLLNDAGALAVASGQDAAMVGLQMQMGLGPEVVKLIDVTKPWHAAVWMESLVASPVIAVVLPIEDFAAFETAVAASMLGQLGAQYLEVGDKVVLLGSTPGAIVPDGWEARATSYVSALNVAPEQTIEIGLQLSADMRQAAVAALAFPKAQMMAAFDQPGAETAGMSPEAMKGIMEGYFTFYETMLRETEGFDIGFGVDAESVSVSMGLTPLEGSGMAEFIALQNVDVSELADIVNWDSGMAMIMGMGKLPEAWDPVLNSLMESVMPLYGLEKETAAEWVDVMKRSVPFRGVYSISFMPELSFYGFYDLLDASVDDLYEDWLEISSSMSLASEGAEPYYSEITIERDVRKAGEHSVDRIVLVLNPDHPSMQLPEQKEAMEKMFNEGRLVYEMAPVSNRVYVSSEGAIEQALNKQGSGTIPFEIGSDTRFVGSIDFVEILEMGFSLSGEAMPAGFEDLEPGAARVIYSLEANDGLTFGLTLPLETIGIFSQME